MFFRLLGQIVRQFWFLLLAGWILLWIGTHLAAPPWADYTLDQEFAFLPKDSPSRRAGEVFAQAFPEDKANSNIVLVLRRTELGRKELDRDLNFIQKVLYPALRQIAEAEGGLAGQRVPETDPFGDEEPPASPPQKRSLIAGIHTPGALFTGPLYVSPDRQAMLVVVDLTTDFLAVANWPIIDKVEKLIGNLRQQQKLPPGMEIALTGSAVIGRDYIAAENKSIRDTELLTMALVVGLLIGIYRAPLLALIPLLTVYLTVQIALNLLAMLAREGYVTLYQGLQVFITILVYGAGVDYCLFLTARYKEELERGSPPDTALARTVADVGHALVASAATVMFGIAMMAFAEFGKFREAGIAIPLSLALALVATLTFSPALLRLAGRWAFWPHRLRQTTETATRPTAAARQGWLQGLWDGVARVLLRRPATLWLVTVGLMAPFVVAALLLYNHLSYDFIHDLPADSPSVTGMHVLQKHFPAGMAGSVTVLLVNAQLDFDKPAGREFIQRVTDHLRDHKEQLGLADIRSLSAPLGITAAATNPVVPPEIPADVRQTAIREGSRNYYLSSLGERVLTATRLDLVLQENPFTRESVRALQRIEGAIRAALPEKQRDQTRLYFTGTTASVGDLDGVIQRDRTRIEYLVVASVFLVLLVLLRRWVVTLYLIVSVLFSYYATLGVTFAVFWLLDPRGFTGIDWKVAIFLFTILIAVGEDYNIFLLTRVHEEEKRHGRVQGILEALVRTGPTISGCGLIMAGTFASLLAGSLLDMKQLGFALAFGVLLDTFVVRPLLVPAFLILLSSGRIPLLSRVVKAPAQPGEAPRPWEKASLS